MTDWERVDHAIASRMWLLRCRASHVVRCVKSAIVMRAPTYGQHHLLNEQCLCGWTCDEAMAPCPIQWPEVKS